MEEIWKDIKGYEGFYKISNLGRLKSLDRVILSTKRKGEKRLGCMIKPMKTKTGYLYVNLWKWGINKTTYIHRLVAEAFIENPNNLPQINHKNEDKSDNRVENLEWCTSKYNMNYGNIRSKIGLANRNNSFWSRKIGQYNLNGELIATYPSAGEAERQTGICCSSIRKVCRGIPKFHTAGGYIWKEIDSI